MNDTALTALIGTGGGTVVIAFLRWAVTLWATIRREELEAAKANAVAQRADGSRMVEALLAQATSNAALAGSLQQSNAILGGKLDHLSDKLDLLVDLRERTPVEMPVSHVDESPSDRRKRLRTVPQGHRTPKAGDHNE
jgi:hypothetical protein